MPRYRVIKPGFYNDRLYDPQGKRNILPVDKPFKKGDVPSWVDPEPLKAESAAEKKKRVKAETEADKKAKEKKEQDEKDIQDASFIGAGESAVTETL